ncbi:uncharacterized protein ACB058_010948 [Synchiropus picturatus]
MFRLSVLVFVSLIFGIAAKPHKPWNKITDQTFQDTLMSVDTKGKLEGKDLKEEVEPPEDMDETTDDIDPRMLIWKHNQETHSQKAEEVLEDRHHLSAADPSKVENLEAADIQPEPSESEDPTPEDLVRAWEMAAKYLAPLWLENPQRQPDSEQDAGSDPVFQSRLHHQPEEDLDHLFHPNVAPPLPVQVEARTDVEIQSPRKHMEPEEDLDHMHHL